MLPLFSSFTLKGIPVKNRVIMPPMVCFGYAGENGMVTARNIDHYRERAEGGAGIIVVEATCILPGGRIIPDQLGIWSDEHIEGLSRLAGILKSAGSLALIQIQHSGLRSHPSVSPVAAGPSPDAALPNSRSLTVDEIYQIRDAFVKAAIRACKAGFDGVQIHGAHGYLLSQFASVYYNSRMDEFGRNIQGRMRLAEMIIRDIRKQCGDHFVIAYRMGANSPSLEDGIDIARYLSTLPVDLLDVSHGGSLIDLPRPPKDFPYNWICYSGTVIKEHSTLPVSVVNEIRTPERANYLIEHQLADFVNIGRPLLADPHWVSKAHHHEEMIVECLNCKPKCKWYTDSNQCPAYKIRMNHQQTTH